MKRPAKTERSRVPLPRSGIGDDSVVRDSNETRNADAFRSAKNGAESVTIPSVRRGRMARLPDEHYLGHSFVHWSMAMDGRKTGWLSPLFHAQFREIQFHTLTRHRLICLVYCLMPDHLHMLWAGLAADSNQNNAAIFFRRYLNKALAGCGAESVTIPSAAIPCPNGTLTRSAPFRLQKQAWDVVLREKDRERDAIERLLFYITENPVRAELVSDARAWSYSGAQAAGFPELDWRQSDFTERLWKIYWSEREKYGAESVTIPSANPNNGTLT